MDNMDNVPADMSWLNKRIEYADSAHYLCADTLDTHHLGRTHCRYCHTAGDKAQKLKSTYILFDMIAYIACKGCCALAFGDQQAGLMPTSKAGDKMHAICLLHSLRQQIPFAVSQ